MSGGTQFSFTAFGSLSNNNKSNNYNSQQQQQQQQQQTHFKALTAAQPCTAGNILTHKMSPL